MPSSPLLTSQHPSSHFVESCGAILFDLNKSPPKICLVHYLQKNEWLLAKGRRNIGESRHETAVREVQEETGFHCHLHPVTMPTRAPSKDDDANAPDVARVHEGLTEPFMLTIRQIDEKNVKIIWWFVAVLDQETTGTEAKGEEQFKTEFVACEEALQKLTFQGDRELVQRAVELVGSS